MFQKALVTEYWSSQHSNVNTMWCCDASSLCSDRQVPAALSPGFSDRLLMKSTDKLEHCGRVQNFQFMHRMEFYAVFFFLMPIYSDIERQPLLVTSESMELNV